MHSLSAFFQSSKLKTFEITSKEKSRASEAARHPSEAPAERSKTEKFFGVPVRHLIEDLPGDLLFRQEPLQKER